MDSLCGPQSKNGTSTTLPLEMFAVTGDRRLFPHQMTVVFTLSTSLTGTSPVSIQERPPLWFASASFRKVIARQQFLPSALNRRTQQLPSLLFPVTETSTGRCNFSLISSRHPSTPHLWRTAGRGSLLRWRADKFT